MKKLTKYLTGILFGTFLLGITAFAAEVTPVSGIGYTTADTEVKTEASVTGTVFLTKEQCPDNIALLITGVTDTGFWEIDLGEEQKYYIEGAELVNVTMKTGNEGTEKTVVIPEMPEELLNQILKWAPFEYTEADIQNLRMAYASAMDALSIAANAEDDNWYASDIPVDMTYVTYENGITELKYHNAYGEIDGYLEKLYPDYMFLTLRARKIDRNWFKQWTIKG